MPKVNYKKIQEEISHINEDRRRAQKLHGKIFTYKLKYADKCLHEKLPDKNLHEKLADKKLHEKLKNFISKITLKKVQSNPI
jgi:hypothetical protein